MLDVEQDANTGMSKAVMTYPAGETRDKSWLNTQLKQYKTLVLLKRLIWKFVFAIDLMKFFYVQRLKGFQIPSMPYFDSDATTDWFKEKLLQSNIYLEYGPGGSTYLAAKLKLTFITVGADKYFLNAVRNKIIKDGLYDENTQTYIYANIGLTKDWDYPLVFRWISQKRLGLFSKYSDFPVAKSANGPFPDLILVDGRFRVACALKAIKELKTHNNWTLVIDDYVDRPEYRIIESFAKLDRYVGRMAVFVNDLRIDDKDLNQTIKQYEHDPR